MLTLNFLEILRFEMGFTGGVIVDTAGESHGNSEFPSLLDVNASGEDLPCIYQGLVLGDGYTPETHADSNLASIYEVHECPSPVDGELWIHLMYNTLQYLAGNNDNKTVGRVYCSAFYYSDDAPKPPEIKELGYITMAGTNVLLARKTIDTIEMQASYGWDPPCENKTVLGNQLETAITFWLLESVSNNTGFNSNFRKCIFRLLHLHFTYDPIRDQFVGLINGEPHELDYDYDELIKIDAGAEESNWGLVLGTGEQVFTVDTTFNLASPISEGTGVGQLEHAEVTAGDCHTYGSQIYFDVIRVFTNNSGADIIVSEVGLIAKNLYLLAYGTFSPLIIEDGESFTMKFRIQV